jgi:nitrite reductase/ring-hydroxylating ferredoxin subunit
MMETKIHSVMVKIAPDTPVGTILSAELAGTALVLVRHAKGWSAAPDACPHAACALSRMGEVVDGTILVCNCHGAEFDLVTGAVLLDPAEAPLQLLDVVESADSGCLIITRRQ